MPVGGIFLSYSPCSYHSCNFHPDSTFISCPDHSFYINMQLFFTSCNQLADGISHRRKLFFIFCHDISHHHILLVMQIKGMCQKSPSFRFCHFLEGKFKQIFIVRFKFYPFHQLSESDCNEPEILWKSVFFLHDVPLATDQKNSDKYVVPLLFQKYPEESLHQYT